jgi:hypothetical protein
MNTSGAPRLAILTVLAIPILTVSCGGESGGLPIVEGWTQVGEGRVYTAENLWEYIDGAAVLFEEYGVRTCTATDLSAGEIAVTVDLYDMASPLTAVGVFKRESGGPEVDVAGATVASLALPYQALMVRGRTYAKVNAYQGDLTEAWGRQLLEALAASLPGDPIMPEEFSLLPEEGRVAGSEGFQPGSHLSLTELSDCLYASYEGSSGEIWDGFVVLPSAATLVWEAVGERWSSFEHGGLTVRFREVPYSGLVGVTRTDSGVFGVSGMADEAQLRDRLGLLTSHR